MLFPLFNASIANAVEPAACPPAAVVSGAGEMAASVAALLRQHGVGSDAKECAARVVHASLIRDRDARFHVLHIDDGFGRTSERKIADANTAASLIETWALGEDASLLSPRDTTKPAARPPAATAPVETAQASAAPAVAASSSAPSWRVAAVAEVSTDLDGHPLYGAGATGCGRVGPVCVGGRARIARSTQATAFTGIDLPGTAEQPMFDVNRTAGHLMVVGWVPVMWRRITFGPLLGLGAGWERARTTLPNPFTMPSRFNLSRDDFSVAAEAAAIAGVRLGRHWSILTELGASVGRRVSGAPADPIAAALLPPAPDVTLRGSIGIEYSR